MDKMLVELIPKRRSLIRDLMGLNSPFLETNKRYFLKIPRCLQRGSLLIKGIIREVQELLWIQF